MKLTLNLAPPSGSTLVGMLRPVPATTKISRLPSPASAASTALGLGVNIIVSYYKLFMLFTRSFLVFKIFQTRTRKDSGFKTL